MSTGIFGFEQSCNFTSEVAIRSVGIEERPYASIGIANDFSSPFLMPFLYPTRPLNAFERVAEWSVTEVVKKGRDDCDFGLFRDEVFSEFPLDDVDQRSSSMKDSQ